MNCLLTDDASTNVSSVFNRLTSGDLEKFLPWNFSRRKEKMRFPLCSHFQSLVVIENGGTSLSHSGISIFRDALHPSSLASSVPVALPARLPASRSPAPFGLRPNHFIAATSQATSLWRCQLGFLPRVRQLPLSTGQRVWLTQIVR